MKQAKVLSEKELKRVLTVIKGRRHSQRDELVVLLSYLAGLRACEIASLRISDVMDEQGNPLDHCVLVLLADQGAGASDCNGCVASPEGYREICVSRAQGRPK